MALSEPANRGARYACPTGHNPLVLLPGACYLSSHLCVMTGLAYGIAKSQGPVHWYPKAQLTGLLVCLSSQLLCIDLPGLCVVSPRFLRPQTSSAEICPHLLSLIALCNDWTDLSCGGALDLQHWTSRGPALQFQYKDPVVCHLCFHAVTTLISAVVGPGAPSTVSPRALPSSVSAKFLLLVIPASMQ